eukprot:scaffold17366_cov182-Amphora_coffeaeformis.AAC.7
MMRVSLGILSWQMLCFTLLCTIIAFRSPPLLTTAFTAFPHHHHPHRRRQKIHCVPPLKATLNDPNLGIQVAQLIQPSVVLVTPKGVRNMTARGSGFVLSRSTDEGEEYNDNHLPDKDAMYILTAAHVAIPGYTIEITTSTTTNAAEAAQKYPATVVARNTTLDLALLRVDDAAVKLEKVYTLGGLKLARQLPRVGTLAFAHGYPASRLRGPAMTLGVVCGVADGLGLPDDSFGTPPSGENNKTDNDSTIFVVTDAATSGGMSGGPLVDSQGLVLGVNALIRPDLRALGNYAVSSLEVLEFLQRVSVPSLNSNSTVASSGFKVWLCKYRRMPLSTGIVPIYIFVFVFNSPFVTPRGRADRQ